MSRKLHALKLLTALMLVTLLIGFPRRVEAHRPVFTDDAATDSETAVPLTEPEISQVVYREITEESPQIWLSFEVPEHFELYIQVGVPVIDRLKEFRPVMVVVGPGLSGEEVPFEIPEGTGAMVFPTKEVAEPRLFNEPFTATKSWILRSETVSLEQPGRYYLVAYSPDEQTGKLWLSIGKKESFKLEHWKQFFTWRKLIREFHEVD